MKEANLRFSKSIAFASGLASATGFAPLGLWLVTLACFALLLHQISQAASLRKAAGLGYWFGAGQFILGLNWIAGAFRYQDSMPVWLGWIAVIALSLYLAVYPLLAAGFAWRFGRASTARLVLMFAAAWVVTEWMRATVFTGFAWNPLAVALLNMGGFATLVGTYGLSGIGILTAGGLLALARKRWVAAASLFALPALSALMVCAEVPGPTEGPPRPLVRIVQPNIGQELRNNPNADSIRFQKLEALSGTPGPTSRLILWPEAAAPGFIEQEEWNRARVAAVLGPKDVLLTGADTLVYKGQELVGAHNAVFAVLPGGKLNSRYDKAHLVPYGEYLALRWLLEPLGATRLVPGTIDFLPGPGPQTKDVPGFGKIGVQICYEIIFSGEVIQRGDRPEVLFNASNDAWFGTWGQPQFLAQAQLRALEEGMTIVRSTPTGISALIDPRGRVLRSIPYQRAGAIEARLPRPVEPTLFARHGNILSFAFALALALLGIALRPRLR